MTALEAIMLVGFGFCLVFGMFLFFLNFFVQDDD